MRLKNETGLPDSVVTVAEKLVNSHPKMNDRRYSVTELLGSVRQIVLKRRYSDSILQDVQDCFSMWMGTAIHALLEDELKDKPGFITERRLESSVKTASGEMELSGEFDLLDTENSILYDYKTSKVATIDRNRTLKEKKWLQQLYLYADLIEMSGMKRPEKAVIVAFATDHSKVKALADPKYPKHPIQQLEWKLDDEEFNRKLWDEIREKMESAHLHICNPEKELPPCTFSDCWCTEDWAIMKKDGSGRALKRFDSEESARSFYASMEKSGEYRIFHRVSDFMNCRMYCQCSEFCSQWKKNMDAEKVIEDVTDDIPFSMPL